MNRELMKHCLDALDALTDKVDGTGFSDSAEFSNALDVISFIKQELEKPEPEPVAYMLTTRNFGLGGETWDTTEYRDYQWDCDCIPLYTAPTEPNCKLPTCHSQEYQDKLVQEILGQEPETAYICNGCGAIYWENNVSCDCAVPALNQFTRADVYTKGTTNAENR